MGRRRKLTGYSIVYAQDIDSVSQDRIYDPESESEKSLLDLLQCPVADEVLIALRKAFSLTYPRNPFIDGIQTALAEIRRVGAEAMKVMPVVLADLGLPPLPPFSDDPVLNKAVVFQFVFAKTEEIDLTVKVDGRKRRFLDLIGKEEMLHSSTISIHPRSMFCR